MNFVKFIYILCILLTITNCQKQNEIINANSTIIKSRSYQSDFYSFHSSDIDIIFENGVGPTFNQSQFLTDTSKISAIKHEIQIIDGNNTAIQSLVSNFGYPIWDKIFIASDSLGCFVLPFANTSSTTTTALLPLRIINGNVYIQNIIARPIFNQLISDMVTAEKIGCAALFTKIDKSLFCASDFLLYVLSLKDSLGILPRACTWVYVSHYSGTYVQTGIACPNNPNKKGRHQGPMYEYEYVVLSTGGFWIEICTDFDVNWFEGASGIGWNWPNSGQGGSGNNEYISSLEKAEALKYHNLQMLYNPNYVFMMNNYEECGDAYGAATKDILINIFMEILDNRPPSNPNNLTEQQILNILNTGMSNNINSYGGNLYNAVQTGIELLANNEIKTSFTAAIHYLAQYAYDFQADFEKLCIFDQISQGDMDFLSYKKVVRDDVINFLLNCSIGQEDPDLIVINAMIDYGQTFTISNYIPADVCNEESDFYNWYIESIDGGLDYQTQNATWSNHSPFGFQNLPTLAGFNNGQPRDSDGHLIFGADNLYPLAGGNVATMRTQYPTSTANTCALRQSFAFNACGVTIPYIWSDDDHDGIKDPNEADITVAGDGGKYYFLRAEFMVKYCLEAFAQQSAPIHVDRQDVLNGATAGSSFGQNQGIYMMLPYAGANWNASGHCDYLYKVPNKEKWRTTSGFQWPWVGDAYLWILE